MGTQLSLIGLNIFYGYFVLNSRVAMIKTGWPIKWSVCMSYLTIEVCYSLT